MKNTEARARRWVEFLVGRPEFEAADRFLAAVNVGRITRLCDCGCNSFDLEIPAQCDVQPLASPGAPGSVFEMEFRTSEENTSLAFIVFADERGHLAGVDVDYCANSFPVPEVPVLIEPPYHVRTSESMAPNPPFQRTTSGIR